MTSSVNPNMFKNVSMSTTSDNQMNQRGGKNNYDDITSSINPNMFKNASMSTTSDVQMNQRGGKNNYDDATSSVNPNMFKNASMSTTSDVVMNQQGGGNNSDFSSDNYNMVGSKLFNESSVMSSSLDLSEMSNTRPSKKNNKNIFSIIFPSGPPKR